jgi:hypothetical protein
VLAAGCGSGHKHTATFSSSTTTAAPSSAVKVTISAPTHHPKVNAKWPVTVRVTNAAGKPIAATLTMNILFGGTQVGKVDNGRVYHVVGTWREKPGQEITWPADSRGQALAFEAIVKADGTTVKRTYAIMSR